MKDKQYLRREKEQNCNASRLKLKSSKERGSSIIQLKNYK